MKYVLRLPWHGRAWYLSKLGGWRACRRVEALPMSRAAAIRMLKRSRDFLGTLTTKIVVVPFKPTKKKASKT